MEWYYVWWPWLNSKCVAWVSQHQLSFLLLMFVNLWPISTLFVADMVHVVADIVCGRCGLWPMSFPKSLSQDHKTQQIAAGRPEIIIPRPTNTANHCWRCTSALDDRKSLAQDHKMLQISAGRRQITIPRPQNTANHCWKMQICHGRPQVSPRRLQITISRP